MVKASSLPEWGQCRHINCKYNVGGSGISEGRQHRFLKGKNMKEKAMFRKAQVHNHDRRIEGLRSRKDRRRRRRDSMTQEERADKKKGGG